MQATSTAIRTGRFGKQSGKMAESPEIREAFHNVFVARQELVALLQEEILTEGQPELWNDSTALCTHYRTRRGRVENEKGDFDAADAQVHTHAKGIVIRFWVYGKNFEVKTRDLILLRPRAGEKGYEVWLDLGDKVVPHEAGKYALAGMVILANMMGGS